MASAPSSSRRRSPPTERPAVSGMPGNREIANMLIRVGELLEGQEANPFRVRSYYRAGEAIRDFDRSVASVFGAGGYDALQTIDGIGHKLAGSIVEILETGRLGLLDRLEAESSPEKLFARLPGVGPNLAARLHDELNVHTFEELEQAAYNGRLEAIEGVGHKRAAGIRDALAGILGRSNARRARRRAAHQNASEPAVDMLLDLDEEYRRRGEKGELRRITPRRFNPKKEKWLPILKTRRLGWEFTVLFSNTRRAHELGKTRDWVVIYFHRDGAEDQCTIVTATSGEMKGHRVIRGREKECLGHYRSMSS